MKFPCLASLTFGAALAALSLPAAAAPEGRFQPLSTTAMAITGPITLTPGHIAFGDGAPVALTAQGVVLGIWDFGGATPVNAEVFRLGDDPGRPLNDNTLCGDDAATHIAMKAEIEPTGNTLELLVFSGDTVPAGADSPGLCGTYNYTREPATRP